MTRDDLVRLLVDTHGNLSYKDMCSAVKYISEVMVETLCAGGRIEVRGFGSFTVRSRPSRLTRNPKTGAVVQMSQKFSVHFKAGKELRERVNNAYKDVE